MTIKDYNSELYAQVSARKSLLTKSQVKHRLKWCKAYSAFGTADFNRIVFSDESKFATFSNIRRYVWRPKNSRYNGKYTCKTVKY